MRILLTGGYWALRWVFYWCRLIFEHLRSWNTLFAPPSGGVKATGVESYGVNGDVPCRLEMVPPTDHFFDLLRPSGWHIVDPPAILFSGAAIFVQGPYWEFFV